MNNGGGVAALILAAGNSTRLGALKPLLPLGGATVMAEVVSVSAPPVLRISGWLPVTGPRSWPRFSIMLEGEGDL